MQIVFSDHALARLNERNISKLQVYATIKNPEEVETSYRERTVYNRKFNSKTIEVVTKRENGVIVVISAYVIK